MAAGRFLASDALRFINSAHLLSLTIAAVIISPPHAWAQSPKSVWEGVFSAAQAEAAKSTFDRSCSPCHGAGLTGTPGGPPLKGGDFAYSFGDKSVAELVEFIRSRMPLEAPDSLTPQQATALAAYILRGNGFPVGNEALSAEFDDQANIIIKEKK